MSGAALDPRLHPSRAAPRKGFQLSWSNPTFRNLVWQVIIVGAVLGAIWFLVSNTRTNLAQRNIATGFDFLDRRSGFGIGESLLNFTPDSTYGRAIVVGILNTLKVAVVGVILATIWGTLVGIARLSTNYLLAKLAAIYVEVIRDIPLLLQLFFWFGLFKLLPPPRTPLNPVPGVYLSNSTLQFASLQGDVAYWWVLLAFVVGLIGTVVLGRRARRQQDATGRRPTTWPMTLGLLVGLPLVVWLVLGAPFRPDVPVQTRFSLTGGGVVTASYAALLFGLVIYTASYIAEIVRSGILAVPPGQWEAAGALGLRRSQMLRRIVLPQAMRVIIPPMTSQYLNLTKNSSLAKAIGFIDIVSVADTTLNQTGQAIESVAVIMATYLTFSLSISAFMNWYNARIALVER